MLNDQASYIRAHSPGKQIGWIPADPFVSFKNIIGDQVKNKKN